MLGKTNITTLSEGAILTEIEDFNWIKAQAGVTGNFVKAIYENGYLAAITADGKVAYTTDGEAWQIFSLKCEDCELEDIAWDGNQFLLAGSYRETINEAASSIKEYYLGFIATTVDFTSYDFFGEDTSKIINVNNPFYNSKYVAVYPINGKWIVLARPRNGEAGHLQQMAYLVGSGSSLKQENTLDKQEATGTYSIGKNSQGILVTNPYGSGAYTFLIDVNTLQLTKKKMTGTGNILHVPVFECKDELYYSTETQGYNYGLVKVLPSGEEMRLSEGINYGFVDGVYFNGCKIFINNHAMLILKKQESIADKTLDDLIEISPEKALTCITKAFGQLFVFGNNGLILKSSTNGNSEETLLIQTISAKQALLEAKAYTDQMYEQLAARIAVLEAEKTKEIE